jgi:hypothetical protein
VNESPKVVLERFLVLLLTREKVALCKLWTLKTLEIRENPLLQVVPPVNHTRTQERIPLRCRFVGRMMKDFTSTESSPPAERIDAS